MDELSSSQPVEHLERLLEYLTSPVHSQGPLKPVRNLDGRIVALRSAEGDYPVVNNIPQMLPG